MYATASVFLRLLDKFLLVYALDIVLDSLESGKVACIVHQKLPVLRFSTLWRCFVKNEEVVEAEIWAVKIHLIGIDLLAVKRISIILC